MGSRLLRRREWNGRLARPSVTIFFAIIPPPRLAFSKKTSLKYNSFLLMGGLARPSFRSCHLCRTEHPSYFSHNSLQPTHIPHYYQNYCYDENPDRYSIIFSRYHLHSTRSIDATICVVIVLHLCFAEKKFYQPTKHTDMSGTQFDNKNLLNGMYLTMIVLTACLVLILIMYWR